MNNIAKWIAISMAGLSLLVVLGFMFGGINMAIVGIFVGMIMFMPVMQMIGVARQRGFLPFFLNLKEDKGVKTEKFVGFPDRFGRLKFFIVNTRHEGICSKKGMGIIDDKGTEYALGNCPLSFGEPKLGMTIDVKNAHYTELLEKNRNIEDYDEAIKTYLGEDKYKEFVKKYRDIAEPDIYEINRELQYLIDAKPADPLTEKIFGETYGFKNFCRFLKYAYHPMAMENAVDTEKIWTKREQMGYKDVDKSMARAKAVVMVIIGVVILVAVLSALDLGNITKLFGM